MQAYKVVFDDGQTVHVELKSRDVAKAERLGVKMGDASPVVGSYALAFVALQRMQRAGLIDFPLPKDAEGLEDIADLEVAEDDEDPGEDTGPVAVSG
jgi:hypothetical protein